MLALLLVRAGPRLEETIEKDLRPRDRITLGRARWSSEHKFWIPALELGVRITAMTARYGGTVLQYTTIKGHGS